MTFAEIQKRTEDFSLSRDAMVALIHLIEQELTDVRRKHLKTLTEYVAVNSAHRALLVSALQSAPELFKKPRTQIFDRVKVGYQKQKGKTIIEDEDATVAKIIKLLGEKDAVQFLNVATTVNKSAVNDMPGDIMKKVGIQITADTDAIVIKPLDGEIEKLVASLLDASDMSDRAAFALTKSSEPEKEAA